MGRVVIEALVCSEGSAARSVGGSDGPICSVEISLEDLLESSLESSRIFGSSFLRRLVVFIVLFDMSFTWWEDDDTHAHGNDDGDDMPTLVAFGLWGLP